MRYLAVLAITFSMALALGACGGDETGDVSGDLTDPAPSNFVPEPVDPAGMNEAELEAKVEELEKLHDAKMNEMEKYSARARDGSMDPDAARELMQINADMKAIRIQMGAYEDAIDALGR